MTKRFVTVAVVAALALVGQPVLARGSRGGGGGHSGGGRSGGGGGHPSGGGGHYSGGGHSGGGYAVPRGGGHGGYAPGGVAQARHPSAGSGHYGGYYPSYGRGHYPAYGRGHYPYYGYGYGRYYSPYYYPSYGGYYGNSWGFYLGVGGPYAYGSLSSGWPYSYGTYGGYPYESTTNVYVAPDTAAAEEPGAYAPRNEVRSSGDYIPNTGRVRLEVRPDDATVYVDGDFWGVAKESRLVTLRAGRHGIELVRPGFQVVHREVDVVPGQSTDVFVELQRP
jgi:hypothetical protein